MSLRRGLCGGLLVSASLLGADPAPPSVQAVDTPQLRVERGTLVVHLPQEGVTVVAELAGRQALPMEDEGWASWAQRGQLLWRGEMTDSQGRSYNVRILPGYPAPWETLQTGWREAGSDLGEYGQAATWTRMGRHMEQSLRWSWKTSFWEFGLKGSGEAWAENFAKAKARTRKKTFGWPLAYPWATLASLFESAVRIPLGTVGAAGGTAVGVVGVPVVETAWPALKATWHGGVEGLVLPVAAWSWHTLAAPPAALLAAAPRPSRADGTWMRVREPQPVAPVPPPLPSEPALEGLAGYATVSATLDAEARPRLEALSTRLREEMAAIRARYEGERQALEAERTRKLQAWVDEPAHREALLALAREAKDGAGLGVARAEVRKRLVAAGMSETEARTALERIRLQAGGKRTPVAPDKTDPVLGALETLDRLLGTRVTSR